MPWQALIQDATNDGSHEARLWRGSLVAADALRPLELDLFCARVVEIFAVGDFMRAQGIDQYVGFSLIDEGVAFDLYARWQSPDIDGNLRGQIFLQPLVHQIEGGTDCEGRNRYADQETHLLPERRGADNIASLQSLWGCASDRRGNANSPANHQRQYLIVRRSPSGHEKDRTSSHQRGDAHATDGI